MATILRIATGNLVAENTYDDAAAQPVLLRFAAHITRRVRPSRCCKRLLIGW